MPEKNHRSPNSGPEGYGSGDVPRYVAVWADYSREKDLGDVPDLDAIARALGVRDLSAEDIPGVRARPSGFEVWHGKDEKGKRRYIGTFTTISEAARAKEIAEGVARDATMLLTGVEDSPETE